jgi:hypothetical protein
MSLIGLVNLTERLLNQTPGQKQDTQTVAKTATTVSNTNGGVTATEDQFTPSAQAGQNQTTAQAAGLFQVSQFALFSAAAQFLLQQTNAPAQNTVPAPAAQPAPARNAAPASAAATIVIINPATLSAAPTPTLNSNATNPILLNPSPSATTAPVTAPAASTAPTAPTTSATGTTTLTQLQTLNNALAALGLPQSDFARIDQIADIINDFNPVAFTDLVNQLVALAQAASQQSAATAANTAVNPAVRSSTAPANTNSSNTTAANGTGASTNPASFQISELSIRFTGVNETQQSGSNGSGQNSSGNAPGYFSAFRLEVEEINLSLTNNAGQTLQVQTPQQAAKVSTTPASQAATKAAGA